LKDDDLIGTGLAAPDRSVYAIGVEVAVVFNISNKDAALIDDEEPNSVSSPINLGYVGVDPVLVDMAFVGPVHSPD
jgi:hypothetical protein